MESGKEILYTTPVGYAVRDFEVGEDFDWTPYVYNYDNDEEDLSGCCPDINWNECVNRFIRQIRESRGYDVDCIPPRFLMSPFLPEPFFKKDERMYPRVKRAAEFAIAKLNIGTVDKTHKLVDIERLVTTTSFVYLMTFTVKQVDAASDDVADTEPDDGAVTTYQATVYVPPVESHGYKLFELRVKPAPQLTGA